jgi:serine/threonine-protein kinase
MLAGVVPFDGGDLPALLGKLVAEPPPGMKSRAPLVDVPPELERVVMRLLERNASDRYQSAKELLADLEGLRPGVRRAAAGRAPTRALPESRRDSHHASGSTGARFLASGSALVVRIAGAWLRAARRLGRRVREVFVKARRAYAWACEKLPLRWRPRMPWLLIAAAIAVVVLPVAFSAERAGHEGREMPGKAAGPPAASIQQAARTGALALEDLASEFPEDARIQRELVRVNTREGHGAAAMRALARLAAADPAAAQDDEMNDALVASLDGPNDASMAAIRVAEGPFGARGVDVLIDCSSRAGSAQDRCTQSLAKSEVLAHASPAARALLDLRESNECKEKLAAVETVGALGDERALTELRLLNKRTGCGRRRRSDCWPGLRAGRPLDSAIAQIEARGRVAPARADAGVE